MGKYSPEEKVKIARNPGRPGTADFIDALFTDFFEQRGDRLSREDGSILGGIARFHGRPVTVIGHRKGKNLEENLRCNFGMPGPEGYRKAQRLMKQAEKQPVEKRDGRAEQRQTIDPLAHGNPSPEKALPPRAGDIQH